MPSHLHGLNVIQSTHSDSSSQDLLSGPFPDLSLWTHLPFEAEDGSNSAIPNDRDFGQIAEDGDKLGKGKGLEMEAAAIHNGHVNVVTGTTLNDAYLPNTSINVAALLSSFGINPLTLVQQLQPQATPSLAQLLAIHATQSPPVAQSQPAAQPPSKRQRTRKSSVGESSLDSPTESSTSQTPLTVSEDKRRRNTAASARFRLKKKEREIAIENKAKELELKVNELERECEGLRRENGWLKGLVVGVTGGAAPANTSAGSKRRREEAS